MKQDLWLALKKYFLIATLFTFKVIHGVTTDWENKFVLRNNFIYKGPVKLIKQVKIAHSFLQSVSNQFHDIILSLPM